MTDETREEWKQYLTPEREADFERRGEEQIQAEISRYKADYLRTEAGTEAYLAAVYWLGEKRKARESRADWTYYLVIASVVFAAIGVAVGLAALFYR